MTDAAAADALDVNRMGQLSAGQQRELQAAVSRRSKGLVGFALHDHDAFAKDVRDGQVESIEGAITEASVGDDGLTIGIDGQWLTLRRAAGE